MIAFVKDMLIYIIIIAAIIVIPLQLGGYGEIFAAIPAEQAAADAAARRAHRADRPTRRWRLVRRSPCSSTRTHHRPAQRGSRKVSSATRRCCRPIRSLLGADRAARLHGAGRGRAVEAGVRRRLRALRPEFRGAGALSCDRSRTGSSASLRRDRDRRAGPGGDHVDRRRQPVHTQHLSRPLSPFAQRRG